jgi:hypothetical protein
MLTGAGVLRFFVTGIGARGASDRVFGPGVSGQGRDEHSIRSTTITMIRMKGEPIDAVHARRFRRCDETYFGERADSVSAGELLHHLRGRVNIARSQFAQAQTVNGSSGT